jgi:diguanylate cyclase (GGDEF)-like protein/PAS domain S-box-containing protein
MSNQKIYPHQIIYVAGAILLVVALLVGATVFVVMQRQAKGLLSKNLQASLQSRLQLTQSEISNRLDVTLLAATRPLLIDEVQRANHLLDPTAAELQINTFAQNFLKTGFTAVALFDGDGGTLARAGTFTQNPASAALRNLPGRVQLIWDGQLLLHAEIEITQAGLVVGRIITETTMPATMRMLKESRLLGASADMALCAPSGVNVRCFPTTLNPSVVTIPHIATDADSLPMADALAGKTGFVQFQDQRGQDVTAAYAPIGDIGLGLVLKIDQSELFAPVWRQLRNLLPIMLGMLIISLLALRGLLTPLVRQLEQSEAQALQLSADLTDSELMSRSLTEGMAEGVITTTTENIVLQANTAALQLFGYSKDDLLGRNVSELVPERHRRQYKDTIAALAARPEAFNIRGHEVRSLRKDGGEFSSRMSFSDTWVGGRRLFTAVIVDISEHKRIGNALRASELQLRTITNNMPFLIAELDREFRFIFHNKAYEDVYGLSHEQLRGRTVIEAMGHEGHERVREKMEEVLRGYLVNYERDITTHRQGVRRYAISYIPRHGEGADSGQVIGFYALGNDITELKQAADHLAYLANYDSLTGLPKRDLFIQRLEQAMLAAQAQDSLVAVVFLDLVRFKNINDALGHEVGDEMLKEVAQRLLSTARSTDTVARISGDEFMLVLTDIYRVDAAARTAQRILEAFEPPFRIAGRNLVMTASVGIALFPLDTSDIGELLGYADLAMYKAKAVGNNQYQFYTAEMTSHAVQALALENELRQALKRDEFFLHYQPIVDAGGHIVGAEALLRWRNRRRGLISPADFIPLAEATGLILPIGEWVLRQVCLQAKAWCQPNSTLLGIAINVSARQFRHGDLAKTIKAVLAETGLNPSFLNIEITEGVFMHNEQEIQDLFHQLSKLNIAFSIDDFGVGYSNFAYLKRFPINSIKIDRSFIQSITTDLSDAAIVRAIIQMAHSLGLKVVAEGVETQEQKEFLLAHGCNLLQGYYFSRPLLPEAFTELLSLAKPLSNNDSADFQI